VACSCECDDEHLDSGTEEFNRLVIILNQLVEWLLSGDTQKEVKIV
jgi:hypothetical protein